MIVKIPLNINNNKIKIQMVRAGKNQNSENFLRLFFTNFQSIYLLTIVAIKY